MFLKCENAKQNERRKRKSCAWAGWSIIPSLTDFSQIKTGGEKKWKGVGIKHSSFVILIVSAEGGKTPLMVLLFVFCTPFLSVVLTVLSGKPLSFLGQKILFLKIIALVLSLTVSTNSVTILNNYRITELLLLTVWEGKLYSVLLWLQNPGMKGVKCKERGIA